MVRSVARAAALLVVAPYLTFASALAAQHVHEPEPGHDHEPAVAHSHFAPHHVEAHSHLDEGADRHRLQLDVEIDHDDEHVVWVDSSALHESPYQAQQVLAAVPAHFEAVHIERRWPVTPADAAAPAHGPPRPASLFRGPPPSTV